MAAYMISDIQVTDPATYEKYRQMAPASIAQYGGTYIVRGGKAEVVEGDWDVHRLVVLKFDSVEQAKRWAGSPEYAPAKALREKAAITQMILVEGIE